MSTIRISQERLEQLRRIPDEERPTRSEAPIRARAPGWSKHTEEPMPASSWRRMCWVYAHPELGAILYAGAGALLFGAVGYSGGMRNVLLIAFILAAGWGGLRTARMEIRVVGDYDERLPPTESGSPRSDP